VSSFATELVTPTVMDVQTYTRTDTLPRLIYKDSKVGVFSLAAVVVMAALCNRKGIILLPCSFFLSSSIFFSSPNLSGHRLDVYNISTHGVALVRI